MIRLGKNGAEMVRWKSNIRLDGKITAVELRNRL